jgi:hypothetical protein
MQCDQIGQVYALWVIAYVGYFSENNKSSLQFIATFFHGKGDALILTKMGWV